MGIELPNQDRQMVALKELAAAAADARELMRRQAELERDDPESSRS